jgi:nitronate monooxygenase
MGGVAGGRLAADVTAAGGLGLIGGGYGDAEWLDQEFAAAGNARVGCGFITWCCPSAIRPPSCRRSGRPAAC